MTRGIALLNSEQLHHAAEVRRGPLKFGDRRLSHRKSRLASTPTMRSPELDAATIQLIRQSTELLFNFKIGHFRFVINVYFWYLSPRSYVQYAVPYSMLVRRQSTVRYRTVQYSTVLG